MSLKSRIDGLERDHATQQQWPCPECGWSGQIQWVRVVRGADGVVRRFDEFTGAELPEEQPSPPCSCSRGGVRCIEIRMADDRREADPLAPLAPLAAALPGLSEADRGRLAAMLLGPQTR
jgi:hypothetical protein